MQVKYHDTSIVHIVLDFQLEFQSKPLINITDQAKSSTCLCPMKVPSISFFTCLESECEISEEQPNHSNIEASDKKNNVPTSLNRQKDINKEAVEVKKCPSPISIPRLQVKYHETSIVQFVLDFQLEFQSQPLPCSVQAKSSTCHCLMNLPSISTIVTLEYIFYQENNSDIITPEDVIDNDEISSISRIEEDPLEYICINIVEVQDFKIPRLQVKYHETSIVQLVMDFQLEFQSKPLIQLTDQAKSSTCLCPMNLPSISYFTCFELECEISNLLLLKRFVEAKSSICNPLQNLPSIFFQKNLETSSSTPECCCTEVNSSSINFTYSLHNNLPCIYFDTCLETECTFAQVEYCFDQASITCSSLLQDLPIIYFHTSLDIECAFVCEEWNGFNSTSGRISTFLQHYFEIVFNLSIINIKMAKSS